MENLVDHGQDSELYSEGVVKPLEGFDQRGDIV